MSATVPPRPAPAGTRLAPAGLADTTPAVVLHWVLRIGVALEFLGHGMAGLAHSRAWLPYYGVFGVSHSAAGQYMFNVTGVVDVTLAVLVLVRPMRAVLAYMAFWGLMTAVLRPVVGESPFELVERGANWGMPLAFLLLAGLPRWSWRDLFGPVEASPSLDARRVDQVAWVARGSIALLLVGHGGLGVWAHKAEWADFFGFLGISPTAAGSAHLAAAVGWFEVALGVAVLVKPVRELLVFVLVWKLGTELLRPLVGQPFFQFVERAGDYALPVALLLLAALRPTAAAPAPDGPWRAAAPTGRPFPQRWHTGEATAASPVLGRSGW